MTFEKVCAHDLWKELRHVDYRRPVPGAKNWKLAIQKWKTSGPPIEAMTFEKVNIVLD